MLSAWLHSTVLEKLPPGKSVRLVTRSLACLHREPVFVHNTTRPNAKLNEQTPPRWLDQLLSATASIKAPVRSRLFDPDRR